MISVALTTYNGERYLKDQIDSILNQTKSVDEIVVFDDCSNDQTFAILKEYQRLYPHIKVHRNDANCGFIENFYRAISLCDGEYIFLSDQDDIWHENKVEKMINIINSNPNIKILSSSFSFIDKEGKNIRSRQTLLRSNHGLLSKPCFRKIVKVNLKDIYYHNFSQGASLLITKEIKDYYLKHNSLEIYHDYYLNFIGAIFDGLYFLNEQLFDYRLHENNTIGLVKNVSLAKKISSNYCLEEPKKSLEILNIVKSQFILNSSQKKQIDQAITFLTRYIDSIMKHHLVKLVYLNFDPHYFKLKTFKGRMIDLITVLFKK